MNGNVLKQQNLERYEFMKPWLEIREDEEIKKEEEKQRLLNKLEKAIKGEF